jgi:hypothetical protein
MITNREIAPGVQLYARSRIIGEKGVRHHRK